MKAFDLSMNEAERGENEGKVAKEPPVAFERSDENLRAIWNGLFDLRIMKSLRHEEDDELLKTSMLCKTFYWVQKVLLAKSRGELRNLTKQLVAEKSKQESLKAKLKRYALHLEDFPENKHEAGDDDIAVKSEDLSDLDIIQLPVKPEWAEISEVLDTGVKRLSSEGQGEEQTCAKKIKIEPLDNIKFDPLDFFKEDKRVTQDIIVPETIQNEDQPCFFEEQPAQLIPETLNESQDLFQETICVLRENSPTSNRIMISAQSSPTTPKSPILTSSATPKSPIILTARARKNLFENRENRSPRSSPGGNVSFTSSPVKQSSKNCCKSSPTKLDRTSTPCKTHSTKASPAKFDVKSSTFEPSSTKIKVFDTSCAKTSIYKPSPSKSRAIEPSPDESSAKTTALNSSPIKDSFVKPELPVSPTKNRKHSPVKQVKGKEIALELKFQSNLDIKQKEVKPKTSTTYLGGRSKLEVTSHDKPIKPVKMKQSKLSLSMFQGKKTLKTSVMTEEQLLQQALEESLKTAQPQPCEKSVRRSLDTEATLFEPHVGEETFYQSNNEPVTFFDEELVDTSSLVNVTKQHNSSGDEEKAMTSRQHHASNFLNITTWNQMPQSSKAKSPTQDDGEEENSAEKYFCDPPEKVKDGRPLNTLEREFVQDYDRVPSKDDEGPGYAYKGDVVRKKKERQQLPGWECHECKGFVKEACQGCNSQERRDIIDKHSRHRQIAPLIDNTPPGIWEIGLLKSPKGLTQVGQLEVHRKKNKERNIDKAVTVAQTPGDSL